MHAAGILFLILNFHPAPLSQTHLYLKKKKGFHKEDWPRISAVVLRPVQDLKNLELKEASDFLFLSLLSSTSGCFLLSHFSSCRSLSPLWGQSIFPVQQRG